MDIEASNAIKLFFPNPSLLMVYFEAIANALDADATIISIDLKISSFDNPSSLQITITDNGRGFTDENFNRFKTLLKPRDEFHKGIGRLLFLDYFEKVNIDSFWSDKRRIFTFDSLFDGKAPPKEAPETANSGSILVFTGFRKERVHSYDDLKPSALKLEIIDHFLPSLLALKRKSVDFEISISLETEDTNNQKDFFSRSESITASDLPEMKEIEINGSQFDLLSNIKVRYHIRESMGKPKHLIAFNIDGRTIPANLINQKSIPAGQSIVFIFESEFFKAKSDTSRQKLILPEGINETFFNGVLRREIGDILAREIPEIAEKNKETKQQFEETFPHLLGYFEETTVGLIERDESLNAAQQSFFKDQKKVLQSEHLDDAIFEKSLELSSRSLTEYILYRDKIIRRMNEVNEADPEADIHNLIVPRYKQFEQTEFSSHIYQNNAWLLDDKFMSYSTILSEARMDAVISAIRLDDESLGGDGRPDIAMIFSADPDKSLAVDVVIVEIKRKTSDEKETLFAINQLLDRAEKLAIHCDNIQRIWYYSVIHIESTLETRLRQLKWTPLFSKGKVYYQEFSTPRPNGTEVPTPIFLLSFDAIVADAQVRNHTFLEILREGMKKYSTDHEA
ncbi:ATP-binding protein [Thalassospira lucentensis]|uniref:ATP-binding protein n=1 Tax=Thalassospira lucentensis TaxID=168935 RepID=UPI002941BA68|nr:ATP-binding protein [Thalassospira lucentensis]WOI12790.1 ATP-binding protein [Thalassospira lucentensis]